MFTEPSMFTETNNSIFSETRDILARPFSLYAARRFDLGGSGCQFYVSWRKNENVIVTKNDSNLPTRSHNSYFWVETVETTRRASQILICNESYYSKIELYNIQTLTVKKSPSRIAQMAKYSFRAHLANSTNGKESNINEQCWLPDGGTPKQRGSSTC